MNLDLHLPSPYLAQFLGKTRLPTPRQCLINPLCPLPVKVILDKYYFLCQPLRFIPRRLVCDGQQDCASGEDEQQCVENFPYEGSSVAGEHIQKLVWGAREIA